MNATATRPAATAPAASGAAARRPGARQALLVLAAAGAAAVANLLVLAVGAAADSSLVVRDGSTAHDITVGGVLVSSLVPVAAGLLITLLLAWWKPVFVRVGQVLGGGLALLSVAGPVTADTDGGTAVTLAVMHLLVGAAVVAALEAHRRRG